MRGIVDVDTVGVGQEHAAVRAHDLHPRRIVRWHRRMSLHLDAVRDQRGGDAHPDHPRDAERVRGCRVSHRETITQRYGAFRATNAQSAARTSPRSLGADGPPCNWVSWDPAESYAVICSICQVPAEQSTCSTLSITA